MIEGILKEKYEALKEELSSFKGVAVAFSGGVDSTFLLFAASTVPDLKVCAITAQSCLFPVSEMDETKEFCKKHGIHQIMLYPKPLEIEGFSENPVDRCYLCKREVFSRVKETAEKEGFFVVAEGSNTDDEGDYRPGHRAIRELDIKSPLLDAGLSKNDIRELSHELGLPTWDKPSFACLASRIPYGESITEEKLAMIEAAENALFDMGYRQLRVRTHGNLARIELLPEDMDRFMEEESREQVYKRLREIGFLYVSLDLAGYRTGSMNEGVV